MRSGGGSLLTDDLKANLTSDLAIDGINYWLKVYNDCCLLYTSFGANAADPHHGQDNTVIKTGDAVLFDVGCIKDGYCSDMTRTFYVQRASEEHRRI